MNCKQLNAVFAESLTGELDPATRTEIEQHLAGCTSCREQSRGLSMLWTKLAALPGSRPSPALDDRFRATLDAYRAGMEQSRKLSPARPSWAEWLTGWFAFRPALQFALVLVLFGSGILVGRWQRHPLPDLAADQAGDKTALAGLREELSATKEQAALALLQQASAGDRLRGVEWTAGLNAMDESILSALVRALDSDPNVNVRLAAVDALQQYGRDLRVRQQLREALPRQDSPLVQAQLIQLVVELEDKAAVPVLKALLEKNDTNESVRERAEWGLKQLG